MTRNKLAPISFAITALMLGGCGMFGHSTPISNNQQLAEFIAHEHASAKHSQHLQGSVNDPKTRSHIYVSLGIAYLQAGHPRQAIRELQHAIQESSDTPNAYNVMGLAYQQLNQDGMADRSFKQAISMDNKNPEYRNNYGGFLVHIKDYANAIHQLTVATNDPMYSTPQFAWTNMAQAYIGLHANLKAKSAIQRALYLMPNYPPALELLAGIEYKNGNTQAAYTHLQIVLAQQPDNANALLLAGNIANKDGNYSQAKEFWTRCVNAQPYSTAGKKAQTLLLESIH